MEFDVYRNWAVRDIKWCQLCGQREENSRSTTLCAHCESLIVGLNAVVADDGE
jgi:hypothetical protein